MRATGILCIPLCGIRFDGDSYLGNLETSSLERDEILQSKQQEKDISRSERRNLSYRKSTGTLDLNIAPAGKRSKKYLLDPISLDVG